MAKRFKACAIENCKGNAHTDAKGSRGYCSLHYARLARHGDPLGGRTGRGEARKFLENAMRYDGDECLIWPFSKNNNGYAVIKVPSGKMRSAARVICEHVHGMPTKGEEAAHSCGNGNIGCINKKHLRWASPSENQRDRVNHGTSNRGEQHGLSKLTAQDVIAIRASAATSTYRELSGKYGVCAQHICDIVNRKIWKWL